MQTIARANRVYEGKSNGLIVDYIGVVKALSESFTIIQTQKVAPVALILLDKEQLLARIVALIDDISQFGQYGLFIQACKSWDFESYLCTIGANAMSVRGSKETL